MSWIVVGITTLFSLFLLFQLMVVWQARKQVGRPQPETASPLKIDNTRPALLYFHSPQCSPCRAMTPVITEMSESDDNVISIDITGDMELARAYRVRATPTVVVVESGTITKVLVGQKSRTTLLGLIQK
ncbi:MAG: thioredoxin family protein [Sedimenticola sp.]